MNRLARCAKWIDGNLVFLLAMILAIALRYWGVGFGLPDELNVDETHVVARAVKFGTGDFNPHFFFYPALHMYLMFAMYGAYFVIGSVAGIFGSAADFGMQYFIDPSAFYLIARVVSVLMGSATVLLAGAFGSRYYGRAAGAAAAILLSMCFLHAEYSHYATTDVPMVFWIMLSLYCAPGPGMRASRRNYVLAGVCGGAAMATKYTAALLLPVLVVMYFLHLAAGKRAGKPPKNGAANLVLMIVMFIASFFLFAPYTILDFSHFKADVLIQKQLLDNGWLGLENIGNMWWHIIAVYLKDGLGLPMLIVSLAGLAWAVAKRRGPDAALLLFVILVYVVTGKSAQAFARYLVPVAPVLCVLGGRLLADAASVFRGRAFEVACAAALLVSIIPARATVAFDEMISSKNTRTIAREWVEDNLPPGTRIAVESAGPLLHPTEEAVTDVGRAARYAKYRVDEADPFFAWKNREAAPEDTNEEKTFHSAALEKIYAKYYVFSPFSLAQYSLDFYRDEGFEYVIASSGVYDRYFAAGDTYKVAVDFYKSLDREAELVEIIPEEPGIRPGPEIKIYRMKRN